MNREFVRQVAVQTAGTVLGGLVLYGLAAVGGLVTVHPQQALTIGLSIFTALCGGIIGYATVPEPGHQRKSEGVQWFLRYRWREIVIGALLAATLGAASVNITHRTKSHHDRCRAATAGCHR